MTAYPWHEPAEPEDPEHMAAAAADMADLERKRRLEEEDLGEDEDEEAAADAREGQYTAWEIIDSKPGEP